jgi:ribosomal protein S21
MLKNRAHCHRHKRCDELKKEEFFDHPNQRRAIYEPEIQLAYH